MDYQPDWKSFLLLKIFGKKRLNTLLDVSQLMWRQDFKQKPSYSKISNSILSTTICVNSFILLAYIIANKTLFKKVAIISPLKIIYDISLVVGSYSIAGFYLSQAIKQQVKKGKEEYLKNYDEDFLFHFNYLSSKYGIEQSIQLENIFSKQQYKIWLDLYYQLKLGQYNQ